MARLNLLVIAAGDGKRMGDIAIPKALYPVDGKPNLQRIIEAANEAKVFDEVFVAIKHTAEAHFAEYLESTNDTHTELLPINSGLGDGHAILDSLTKLDLSQRYIVVWGDAVIDNHNIFNELAHIETDAAMVLPCRYEQDPYVTILVDDGFRALAADFSRLGEVHKEGLHDQSVFLLNHADEVCLYLGEMHKVLWKNGRYISESKELNLLHVLHFMANADEPALVYVTEYPTKSFNSIQEVKLIEKEKVL